MKKILVVLASARINRVADKILEHAQDDLVNRKDITVIIADLKKINLPFYEHEMIPSSPHYVPTNPAVLAWSKLVTDADAVVLLTPEYHHTVNAIQKNAIDSLYREWANKPVVVIGYGWSGASRAIATLDEVLPRLKIDFRPHPAKLVFTKDIAIDGSILDQAGVSHQIKTALDEII